MQVGSITHCGGAVVGCVGTLFTINRANHVGRFATPLRWYGGVPQSRSSSKLTQVLQRYVQSNVGGANNSFAVSLLSTYVSAS